MLWDLTDVLSPLDLAQSSLELLILYLPYGCTEACFLWDENVSYKMLSAVCMHVFMGERAYMCTHVSPHECVQICLVCGNNGKHLRKSNHIGGMAAVRSMICIRNVLI